MHVRGYRCLVEANLAPIRRIQSGQSGIAPNPANLSNLAYGAIWPTNSNLASPSSFEFLSNLARSPIWHTRQFDNAKSGQSLNLAMWQIVPSGQSGGQPIWQSRKSTNPAFNLVMASIWRCTVTQSGKVPDLAQELRWCRYLYRPNPPPLAPALAPEL